MGTAAKRALVVAAVLIASLTALPGVAASCRSRLTHHLEDVTPGQPVFVDDDRSEALGVYEITYLARAPGLMPIIDDRSAMIVTRYWGEPPPELGVQMTKFLSWRNWTECGVHAAEAGTVTYWFTGLLEGQDGTKHHIDGVVASEDRRVDPAAWPNAEEILTITAAQEAALAERWGHPVVLDISLGERVNAVRMLWQWHLLVVSATIALIQTIRIWRRRRRGRATSR